jgi:hypothetical protein
MRFLVERLMMVIVSEAIMAEISCFFAAISLDLGPAQLSVELSKDPKPEDRGHPQVVFA